ncbi:MAG: IS21 family transposase [Deltaproteobacteria bacterium]|nr:IS21 family transposase [Deltaproteobacteria bacterium]
MLIVETIAKIRRYFFVEGKKIKQISRDLQLSRNTVRKVIRSGITESHYAREDQPCPKLGDFKERVDTLLKEDEKRPKRRRLTAQRLYELLQAEGYEGAYDSIQRYVKKWRSQSKKQPARFYIPLTFAPGEAYQFDWSHESVILSGIAQTVKVAHFRLSHSRMFLVIAYPRESQEMLFDAHNRAFTFYGGACKRGIYDNLKTAVDRVLRGKERKFNNRFLQMCSHYLVEPVACTPGSGWEKGQVEKQVKNIREWLFTPRPRFQNFEELNFWLADQCTKICQKRQHPEDKGRTIWEVFQEEKSSMIPSITPFQGYIDTESRVSSTCLIRYDRNHYSVDSKLAGNTATVRASADRIKVISNGEIVADHPRQFGRDKVIYDPWHYLNVLKRKPGALRNGSPFQGWELPISLSRVRSYLSNRPGGNKEFVDILCAAARHGLELAEKACSKALAGGTIRGEIILNIIARELDPYPVDLAIVPISLVLTIEPIADCSRYDSLREGVLHGAP